ncbi:MAG: hypothetical protein GC186_19970 [Rhodobacteraceae bacterium]|nr:hypothetical protein [Paracoccaceae bacterium]
MHKSLLITSLAGFLLVGVAAPLLAADGQSASTSSSAEKCLNDVSAFNGQMRKDGYWWGGYGAGDPAFDGYAYGYGDPVSYLNDANGLQTKAPDRYLDARSGYEIRVLLIAADILARHGQQQECENVVAAARDHYQQYVADMEAAQMPMANVPGWQRRQIAAAQPATSVTTAFRSDQLLGTEVRDPRNQALGSVDDLVTSPQTGKIAYLVIARGGWLFGVGEKYVAVPWDDFEIAPNAALLVLDTTKGDMDAAPQVAASDLTTSAQQRQKVDAYWKAHTPSQAGK